MRLSSTSRSPSLLPSPPSASSCGCCCYSTSREDSMHSAKAATALPSARQGLVFRGQTAKFSDGYIVQLDSLLLRRSPTARRPPAQHGLRLVYTLSYAHVLRMCSKKGRGKGKGLGNGLHCWKECGGGCEIIMH